MPYERPSGYGLAFCRVCSSPAPFSDRERTTYEVPVGLLDDDPPLAFGAHIYVGSKANWDVIGDDAPQFDERGPPRPRDQVAWGAAGAEGLEPPAYGFGDRRSTS